MPALLWRAFAASALSCLLLSPSASVLAHGNHTHGHGSVRAELKENVLEVAFDVPLESLLGFDFPPQGDAQQALWQALPPKLDAALWLQPAAAAACVLEAQQVSPELATARPEVDIANLKIELRYRCANPQALDNLAFPAFKQFAGLKQLRLQWLQAGKRKTVTVRPRFPAVTW